MIDALTFQNELSRMCKAFDGCLEGCPAHKYCFLNLSEGDNESHRKLIEVVEQWSKENPQKTRADKFKEVFGVSKEELMTGYSCGYSQLGMPKVWWNAPYEALKEVIHE